MPRIPVSAGVPRGSFAGLVSPHAVGQVARAGAKLGEQVLEFGVALDRQREHDETNRGTLAGLQALGALEDELLRDNSILPDERIRRYKERSREVIEDVAGDSKHPRAGQGIRNKLGLSSERQLVRMQRDALADEKAASITTLDQMKTEYINRAATAQTQDEQDLVVGMYASAVNKNEYLEPHEKEKELAGIPRAVEETRARRLATEDPGQLVARMDAGEFMEIPGPLRESLRNSAIAEAERQATRTQRLAREARLEQEEQTAIEFVQRFYDADHPEGVPSIPEILSAPMPRSVMEHFVGLAQEQAKGADIDWLDDSLVNDLFRRVHDPGHANPITRASQLLPYIGDGLPRDEYEKLRADIESLSAPGARESDALFTEFLKRAESSITKTSLFGKDAKGDQNMLAFRVRAQRLWEKALQEGRDPLELIDPNSPDYIGKIIPQYMRTPIEQAHDQVKSIRGYEIEGPDVPLRLEGESPAAYLERMGQ